ncbi:WhiB family transcriptional regulator [Aldersonia kunmingensis]|uniref:WhiB family transcriptional regulator n=1 Tax=Aldersonia kunmingensis TaxID=408066 RepID=UPI000ABA380C|nr:WhiB family transcriptional regulator [Aldersonia kunmingensis]
MRSADNPPKRIREQRPLFQPVANALHADTWEWRLGASCRGEAADDFFVAEQVRGKVRAQLERRAKRVCRDCPVLEDCRRYAVEAGEPHGIWGGLTTSERASIRRQTAS